jgi:myo-inositol-1(or 4)-monophosphatase
VSFGGIPLLLKFRLGHYHEPQTRLALIWKDGNLAKELEAVLSAAKEAGEVLRKGFGWKHSVKYKGEVDLVTEVDEQAEQVIREILLGAFPAYGMLAEEGGALVGEEDARWIVDPLDGTTNYAHGLSLFCVSIALERAGEVVLGVWYTTP